MKDQIPQYQKIKTAIKSRIRKGIYSPGAMLPSENELVREFNVSKHTVLKALSELINENLIYRKQGKGTFASESGPALKKQVAVIVYHSDNPYFSKVVKGIVQKMSDESFNVFLANSEGDPAKETEHIKRLADSVDAFIIAPTAASRQYSEGVKFAIESGIPVTFVTNSLLLDPLTAAADYVIPDDCSGAFIATKHLIDCGCRNIRLLTTNDVFCSDSGQERLRGFKFALAQHKIDFDENMIMKISSDDPFNGYENDAYLAGKKMLLPRKCTGIFSCDSMAIGLMRALKERGINIPDNVKICGFDDIDLARQWGIELTTIAQKRGEMGEMAAAITLEKLRRHSKSVTHKTVPVELVIRGSTGKTKEALSA